MQKYTQIFERRNWLNESDKELLCKMFHAAELEGISERRLRKYASDLGSIHKITGLHLQDMIKDEMSLEQVILQMNKSKYSWELKKSSKIILGQLYQLIHHKDRSLRYASKEIKRLCTHKASLKDKILAKEVLSRQDIRDLMPYCSSMEKALVFSLFESGARIGEFVQIRREHLQPYREGLELTIPAGKTYSRKILLIEATSYVLKWLDDYQNKAKDAPLWVSDKRKPLKDAAISKRVRMIVERANRARKAQGLPIISKPINVHNFRHSRASELGAEPGMSESIMDKFFGWSLGSKMSAVYLHLTDSQIHAAVLRVHGKAPPEVKAILTSKTCPKCKMDNPLAAGFCNRCGFDLDKNTMPSKIEMLEARLEMLEKARLNGLRAKRQ